MSREIELRRQLAAAFRWTARFGWNEAVANHFSAAVSDDGSQFLLNPVGRHFARMTAGELLLLDAAGERPSGADPTAWVLHAQLHRLVPRARVALHTHMPYTTALACLDGYELQMIDQNACRFHGRVAYDRDYGGALLADSEGARLAGLLGDDHSVVMLGNHGVLVVGESVADAFDELYYLEHACRVQVLALSTGRRLSVLSEEVAARTRGHWRDYPGDIAAQHLDELMAILDVEEPEYASLR